MAKLPTYRTILNVYRVYTCVCVEVAGEVIFFFFFRSLESSLWNTKSVCVCVCERECV